MLCDIRKAGGVSPSALRFGQAFSGLDFVLGREARMDADEKKIAEVLHRLSGRARGWADRVNCPDEETLALFLGRGLVGDAREIVEAHVATCSYCLEDLVAAYKSGEGDGVESVPQRLMAKAMALVSDRENSFELAVRLVEGSIRLIRTTARVVPVPVPVLRGEPPVSPANMLQVEQAVGRFKVAVELDLSEAGLCQVVANVKEESGKPAEGVRLSLSSEDREHASFLTRGGVVVFDRILPGEYSIAVSESGTQIGKIRLNLMMER